MAKRGEPDEAAAAVRQAAAEQRDDGEGERRHVRLALPVAHLAGRQAAEILRTVGAGEQGGGNEQRERFGEAKRAGACAVRQRLARRRPGAAATCGAAGRPSRAIVCSA